MQLPDEEPRLITWDDLPHRTDLDEFERKIAKDPFDVKLRALLMMRLVFWASDQAELQSNRLRQILWFIENVPDWKYCGSMFVQLKPTDFGFAAVENAWKNQIENSDNVMRRVNNYLLHYSHQNKFMPELFDSLFENYKENLWVRWLKELKNPDHNIFDELLNEERNKPLPTTEEIEKIRAEFDEKLFHDTAYFENHAFNEYQKALKSFDEKFSLKDFAVISGYSNKHCTFFFEMDFDPEILMDRIRITSWTIRHMPWNKAFRGGLLISPFDNGSGFEGSMKILAPIKFFCDLWLEQFERFPEDLEIARNAAWYGKRIWLVAPEDYKRMMKALGKTAVGKRAKQLTR